MATAATIKKNIAKLEAALKSKATPKSLKSKLETQLVKSKAELSGINKGSKPKTTTSKSTQTALQKLKEMVNKNKKLKTYKKSGVDLEKDADRPALPIGRRTAKQSGKTYYEYRANRIDVKQPPKRYPKLEKGGRVDDFSDKIQEGDIVWDSGNNSYGVVLNTYDFKYGEIRLDSDGNQPEENLHKLGSKGDKGTKEKLKSALLAHKSLITKYPEMGYEKVNYAKGGMSQGYDDREDERLGMKDGKMSSKDLDSTHARRDDARFEERGKMAKGGEIYSGKDIKITIPKMGKFDEQKVVAVYDKNNFIFKIYDKDKKRVLTKMGGTNFESNLMNGSYKMDGYMADGGVLQYESILDVLKQKIDDSMEDLPSDYEMAAETFKGEEVERESRPGFIPYTDGGYEARWFDNVGHLNGSGISLPTAGLDAEMQRQVDYNYEVAKDRFKDEYPDIVEELGEDNIEYNALYDAGYESEAEQLSEYEMDYDGDDTIMMEIGAFYYSPENSRGKDNKHTISVFANVNLESPYHRSGNLEDGVDHTFTFNSLEELKEKMDENLKKIVDWFDGKNYKEGKKDLKVTRMAKGGMMAKGGYFAKGGAVEHGLEVGDLIDSEMDEFVFVKNKGENFMVNLNMGTRKKLDDRYRFAMGGEMHRTQE